MSGYLRALPILLGIEGGRNDDPDDLGGRTNFGVTQDVYDEYRDHRRLPRQDVYLITTDEVRDLYHVLYWLRAKCDSLPWPMSHVHFDTSVHHGVDMAARSLQRTVGVKDDAIIGARLGQRADLGDMVGRQFFQEVDGDGAVGALALDLDGHFRGEGRAGEQHQGKGKLTHRRPP